jgi:hypothetical protein
MSELDLGWQDVLRRAQRRRRVSPRIAVAAVAVAAVSIATPALGVLLTRPGPPQLARDRITGPVRSIVDPRTHLPIVEYGRWKNHDGICYLVPHVRAACLLRGEQSRRLISLPTLYRLREQVRTHRRWVIRRPVAFHVVALPGGRAKIVRGR